MAISRTPNYVTKQQFAYEYARNTSLFDEDTYNTFNQESPEMATDYALATANIKEIPENFDHTGYKLLNPEDKYSMILNEFYQDKNETTIDEKTGDSYNVYEKNKEYFNQQIESALEQKTYEGLTDFEKGLHTVVGIAGNVLNEVFLGSIEGILDLTGLLVGNTEFVAKDITGYSGIKEDLNKYARSYTNINKDFLSTLANDVIVGLAKMTPMLIPGAGTTVYFGAMAGNVAEQTLQTNPDIDYASLLGYTAATTGLEIATEKLFGDVIFKKGLFNIGYSGIASKNIYTRLAADFATEGFEEMAAEIGNSILYKTIIDPEAPTASINDILYAGLIGGIIGGTVSGGAIATTSKIKIGDKELSKLDSLSVMENLNFLKQDSTKDAVLDLAIKNLKKGESTQQAIDRISKDSKYSAEYSKALESNLKRDKTLVKSTLALANVYNKIGVEQFQKSLKLLDYNYEARAKEIRNYTQSLQQKQNIKVQELTKRFKSLYPNESILVSEISTPEQERYKQLLYKQYKKEIVFVDFGSKEAKGEYHAFVMDENTIFINNEVLKNMSPIDILNKIVKEELVHSLQRNGEILSADNIAFLDEYIRFKTGENVLEKELDKSYSKDSLLVKKSEKQAKALAEMLLFDDLAIEDILITKKSIFYKTYKFIKNIANSLTTKTEKNKIKYNALLKIMKTYRNSVSKRIGNDEDLNIISFSMGLSDDEKQKIKNDRIENYNNEHFCLMKIDYTNESNKRDSCLSELCNSRQRINRLLPLSYRNIFDETYYDPNFVNLINKNNPQEFFKKNLQDYLIKKYGFVISQENECLLSFIDLNFIINQNFKTKFNDAINKKYQNPIDKILYGGKNADRLNREFNTINKLFNNNASKEMKTFCEEISLYFYYDRSDPLAGNYNRKTKEISVNLAREQTLDVVLHELTHLLAEIQGLPLGSSPIYIRQTIGLLKENQIKLLTNLLLDVEYAKTLDKPSLLDNLSVAIYKITDGEINANLYDKRNSSFSNISGFYTGRDNNIYGYGRFLGIEILSPKRLDASTRKSFFEEKSNYVFDAKNISGEKIKENVVSFSKSEKQKNIEKTLADKGLVDYESVVEKGYNDDLAALVDDEDVNTTTLKRVLNASEDKNTIDLLIPILYPENVVKNTEDLNKMILFVLEYSSGKGDTRDFSNLKTTILNKNLPIKKESGVKIYNALEFTDKREVSAEIETKEGAVYSYLDKQALEEETMEEKTSREMDEESEIKKLIAFKKNINNLLKIRNANIENTKKIEEIDSFLRKKGIAKYQEKVYSLENSIIESRGVEFFDTLLKGIPNNLLISKLKNIDVNEILYEFNQKIKKETDSLDNNIDKLNEELSEEELEKVKKAIVKNKNSILKIKDSLEKDKSLIVESFGQETYDKLFNKIPEEFSIEKYLKKQPRKEKKLPKEEVVKEDKFVEETPKTEEKTLENITIEPVLDTKDEQVVVKEAESISEEPKTVLEEVKKASEEPKKSIEKLDRILNTKYDTSRVSEVQRVGEEINTQHAVVNIREFLFKNEKDLENLTNEEADAMLDALLNKLPYNSVDVDEQRTESTNRLLLVMYIKENQTRFSDEIIKKAETYAKQELSLSGTQLGVWSSLFEQANPIEVAIEKFKLNFGKDLKISPEKIKRYKKALRERDYAKQTELEEEFIIELGKQLPEGRFNWTKGTFEERQLAFKRFMGKANGFRYFAMLTNISTHVQNIISNFMIRKLDDLDNKLIKFFENFGDFDKYKQLKYIGEGKTNPLILDYVNNQFGELFDIIVKVGKYEIVKKENLLEQAEFKNQYKNKLLQKLSNLVFDSLSKMDRVFSRPVIAEKMARLIQSNKLLSNEILEVYKNLADNKITRIRKVKDEIIGSIHSNELNLDFNFHLSKNEIKIDQETSYENITKNSLDSELTILEKVLNENKTLISKAIKDNPLQEDLIFALIENAANRTLLEFLRKPNTFSIWWNDIMDKHWSLKILMSAILPFPTVVSNITIQVFQHSPINLVRGIARKISQSKNGKWYSKKEQKWVNIEDVLTEDVFFMSKTNEMLAKGSSGTALMLVGIVLAAMGLIGFDEDDEYAGIVFDFAGYKVKLAGLAPAISPLLIGAALIHSESYPDLTERLKKIVNDLSILGTFDDLFGYGQDLFTIPVNGLSNYFVQFVPAILRAFSKVIESEKKVDYSNWFSKTIGRIISGIPVVKELLPNKVNPYTGEPIVAYGSQFLAFLNMLTPIKLSKDIDDYLSNETKTLGVSTSGADGTFSINGSSISLDGKALESFQTFRAKIVNTLLTNLIEDIKKYRVQKEDGTYETLLYSEMIDDQKKSVIKSIYSTATEYSKINYWINSGNTYVVTSYDKLAEYKEFISNTNGLIYRSKHSGSKYVKK